MTTEAVPRIGVTGRGCLRPSGPARRDQRIRCRSRGRTRTGAAAAGWRRPRSSACTSIHVSITSSVNTSPLSRNVVVLLQGVERRRRASRAPAAPSPAPRAAARRCPCRPACRRSILFWMPSRPAISIAANARYGLHDGSGQRNSIRLAFGLWRVHRDADGRRAVALAVHQVDRRLVARAPAACSCWSSGGERQQRRRVLQQAADVVAGHVATGRRSRPRRRTGARRPSTATGGCACRSRCPGTAAWA